LHSDSLKSALSFGEVALEFPLGYSAVMNDVTRILAAIEHGDATAATNREAITFVILPQVQMIELDLSAIVGTFAVEWLNQRTGVRILGRFI
jgi:hypothetical protein